MALRRVRSRVRTLAHGVAAQRALAARRIPEFGSPAGSGPRRFLYLCPDETSPSGGVQMIYRHVAALRGLGHDAYVVHGARDFDPGWFPHDPVTVAAADVHASPEDVLVCPEWYGPTLDRLPVGPRTVVLNQGPYLTFDYVDPADIARGAPYRRLPRLAALLTVSEDAERFLRFAFPEVPIHRARPVVDAAVFYPGTGGPRPPRIGYLDRGRRSRERELVLKLLGARGALPDWEIVGFHGGQADFASFLRSCRVFCAFGDLEGFGLPTAEAMASGCYVVGYAAGGGAELFADDSGRRVAETDVVAYAERIIDAAALWRDDPQAFAATAARGVDLVHGRYTVAGLTQDLAAFVRALEPC